MQKTWPKACVAAALLALSAPAGALAQPVINTPFGEPIDEASIEIDRNRLWSNMPPPSTTGTWS